jgi:hypothetical protein
MNPIDEANINEDMENRTGYYRDHAGLLRGRLW